jgi:XTP/dITP diphosphohydrolase
MPELIEFDFVTGNQFKIDEANSALAQYGIQVRKRDDIEKIEIQSTDLETIASAALALVVQKVKGKVVVEDSGLFVHALNGFPGPYSSFVFDTLGIDSILKLLDGAKTRKAEFRSSVAYGEEGKLVAVFSSVTEGNIVTQPRGSNGFGFDPIFAPIWTQKTFAEMEMKEKSVYSHRSKAFSKLALWYLNECSKKAKIKS